MFALRGRPAEHAADLTATTLMSIPEFLWALLLILGLGVAVPLLPAPTTLLAVSGASLLTPRLASCTLAALTSCQLVLVPLVTGTRLALPVWLGSELAKLAPASASHVSFAASSK
jgi:ABC-type dipeptide/oligopeptide/nickel transport system permease component